MILSQTANKTPQSARATICVMFFREDYGHPGVHLDEEFVGFAGNDRPGVQPLVGDGSFQPSPYPANTNGDSSFFPIA